MLHRIITLDFIVRCIYFTVLDTDDDLTPP